MNDRCFREAVAEEAARLLVRRKETDFYTARKRAARALGQKRTPAADLPTIGEIREQVYAITGLYAEDRQRAALMEIRQAALDIMRTLIEFEPKATGTVADGPVLRGAEITLLLRFADADEVFNTLRDAGFRQQLRQERHDADENNTVGRVNRIHLHHRYPCEIILQNDLNDNQSTITWSIEELNVLLQESVTEIAEPSLEIKQSLEDEHATDPEALHAFFILLQRLNGIRQDRVSHPEGDALYHSLQVFELGAQQRSYDEEFLLACLLHDIGLGIDRRNPRQATVSALSGLVTERTLFLVEHLPEAHDYLRTGQMSRSLKKSEHFADLVLLAQCDRDGRVPGVDVPELEEALVTIAELHSAWDDC